MPRYNCSVIEQSEHLLKKYPDLLTSLSGYSKSKLKCEGRILRRDTERLKKYRKFRKRPHLRVRQFFQTMDQKPSLFVCPVCRNVLRTPVTVDCGHTYCYDCLLAVENSVCNECAVEVTPRKRCVNVLVQHLVEKWRERNKCVNDVDMTLPNTVDILGVEPRYHLRSGYAGLHINSETEERISCFLEESPEKMPRYKKEKRKHKTTNICNKSFRNFWLDRNLDNYEHFQETLENIVKEIDDIKEDALKTSWSCISIADVECILCSRCLLDPVTTGCGHTFCRGCLTRVLDHGLSCPLCMASLNIADYSRGPTDVLQQAISFLVPQDYNERMSISIKESLLLERGSDIPVFVCTNAFPGVACPLHVYEPKYRLLARRCLQSSTKRFAMAGKESGGQKFVQYGTVLEVKDAVKLDDGRFILTTVGVRRFKVVGRSEQDGYDTAKINYIKDNDVTAEKLQELISIHERVHTKASKWIKSLKPKIFGEVERLIGKMPKVERDWFALPDGPSWAWWLMPILPLSSQLQVGFLRTTSLEKRLRAIDKMLEHMKIRMKALERNTVACSQELDPLDYCGENGRSFEMPYNNN